MNASRIGHLKAAGALALAAGAPQALGQSSAAVDYHKVIISTDAGQTGWNGVFTRMSAPAMNESGDLAFEGNTNAVGGGRGVWFGDFDGLAYTVSKIAQEGDSFQRSVPGFVEFESDPDNPPPEPPFVPVTITVDVPSFASTTEGAVGISLPIIDNTGQVAFVSSIDSPAPGQGEAVLWRTDAAQSPLLIAGAPYRKVPSNSDDQRHYVQGWFNVDPAIDLNQDYRFKSHVALARGGDGTVAWYSNLDTIDPVDSSDLPPFTPDQGGVEREGGIFSSQQAVDLQDIVRYQDNVPGFLGVLYGKLDGDTRNWFGSPVLNSQGDAAFIATASDGRSVLTAFDRDELGMATARRLIAIDGDALPGTDPASDSFVTSAPVINQTGAVAFRASNVSPALDLHYGIWAEDASLTLSRVIFTTDPVPDFPSAQWTLFGDPVLNEDFEKTFVGRHQREVNGQQVTVEGVYRASTTNIIERVAESGRLAPPVPNTDLFGRNVGVFESFADPLMNDTGNVAFLAGVDITDATLQTNLDGLAIEPEFIEKEGIFFQDNNGDLRTIVASGMTVDDLLGNGDQRVIVDLVFSSDFSRIDQVTTPVREGNGSGHQDGRRTAVTNAVVDAPNQHTALAALTAVLATPGDPDPGNFDQGVFVADMRVTTSTTGGGGECDNCLECTTPDCPFNGLLLGSGPDFDQSGTVDDTDVELMMMAWGYTKGRFDLNKDGVVEVQDLEILMRDFGKTVK